MTKLQSAGRAMYSMLSRTKKMSADPMQTPLNRCLNTFDITLLGIGQMVGAGIYVLTGAVAKNIAGPSIVVSFFISGLASLLAALCYAEFGARVPKTGSAYVYTYITIGEFWAFVVGWNMILEDVLGGAAVARAFSGYVDSMTNGAIRNGTIKYIGALNADPEFPDYPDFLALTIVLLICVFIASGAKTSTNFNTIFTIINLIVILFIISVGFSFAKASNWSDHGGFFPYGFHGVLGGAATTFFAFIGFDGIATAGEEAKTPGKSLPIATLIAMVTVTVAYMAVSAALTLMVPYQRFMHGTGVYGT